MTGAWSQGGGSQNVSLSDITSEVKVDTALEDQEEEEEVPHDAVITVLPSTVTAVHCHANYIKVVLLALKLSLY